MRVGTGGHGRKSLEGKGPTPKAEDRTYHVAYQRKQLAEKQAARAQSNRPRRASTSRTKGDSEVISGRNQVVESLRAKLPLTAIHVAQGIDHDQRTREAMTLATEQGIPLFESTRSELDRLSQGNNHQGLLAQAPAYEYAELDDLLDAAAATGHPPLIVALDGVTDPRNLGAVLRSAAAFGADGVVVPSRRSAGVTASAWRVSAGAAARVPVARVVNLTRALQDLKQAGCFVVGLDAGGSTDVGAIHLAEDPLVVVVGSEGKGLSRLVTSECDLIAGIPIESAAESLNASVATSIALYEIAKARQTSD
jgi:23S rRNA (guanosine2251-2'-O)-methyltransferase